MKLDRKLDDSYRVLIPMEIRSKLDIKKYEPLTLDFNEETKEITIIFKKYGKENLVVKAPISPIEKLPNPITIEPLESISTKLEIRKRNLVTIPKEVFRELDLYEKRYDVFCTAELNKTILTFSLTKNGPYKYRKENVISFSEIGKYFGLNISEGISCNFKYKSDGTLIFTFNPNDIMVKKSKHKKISLEERLDILNSKFMNEGLCKEEFDEMNKIAKQLEPPIKQEQVINNVNVIGSDVQHEIKEYRKQLPKFETTDTIELKDMRDSITTELCPRCGSVIVGDKTLKINGQLHCEQCSKDFKNQLIEELKRKHKG